MLSPKSKYIRFAGLALCMAVLCALVLFPVLKDGTVSAQSDASAAERQLEALKSRMESVNPATPTQIREYDRLAKIISDCSPTGQVIKTFRAEGDPLAPQANLCINGDLSVGDPDHNRPLMASTGTGLGNGTPGNCSLSGSGTAVNHDVYSFNLTGCAAFPTQVTVRLCGPAGCTPPASVDTAMVLYRNVAAGDPLTANGGLPGVFNPASACTNARAANDDSGATPTSPGGSTCDQLNTADCLAQCAVSTGLSEFKRTLGNGRFTIVIGGFGNATTGNYNLYVDAPAAGCAVALAPSAANGGVSGRVQTAAGRGIGKTVVTVSGGSLAQPVTALTNAFGYYTIEGLEAGMTYSVSVTAKGVTFANPTQIVTIQDELAGVDFTSVE